MAAAENDDVIPTPCDVINLFCEHERKQFLTYYLPTKFHCHSFNALEVLRGAESAPPRLRNEKETQAK